MSLRLVPPLPAGTPGDPGLTGPGSVTWRVCRERVVPLGGLSALLLQLAHPLVAAGVAEHSSFQEDPTKRLILTLEMLLVTTFGDTRQVGEMTRRIAHIHRPLGRPYDPAGQAARNPDPALGLPARRGPAARAAACAVRLALVRSRANAVVAVHARRSGRDGPAGSGPAPVLGPLSRGRGALPPGRRPERRSAEHRCGLW